MGKPKRSPGVSSATARAKAATADRKAQYWWDNTVRQPPPERHAVVSGGGMAQPPMPQEQEKWPSDEEGDWFLVELIRELPFALSILIRFLLRLNKRYIIHIWLFVGGWQLGWHGLQVADKALLSLDFQNLLASPPLVPPSRAYAEWRAAVPAIAKVGIKLAACGTIHLITRLVLRRFLPLSVPLTTGLVLRILTESIGSIYAFTLIGVTHTPFLSTLGQQYPSEGDALKRAATPVFIICLIAAKHVSTLGWSIPGIFEPNHPKPACVWIPALSRVC
uniref:Uncharacterized protein n=1 Tax=Hemiselmis andersenii TaxID=464988 RepID=A0A7S0Y6S0_HEMAN